MLTTSAFVKQIKTREEDECTFEYFAFMVF